MNLPILSPEDFVRAASSFGIPVSRGVLDQFAAYERTLLSWNRRVNLIARGDEPKLWSRHFLDSLVGWSLAFALRPSPCSPRPAVMDIGTGAGFPGLPIRLVWPYIRLSLVESIRKKALFLKHLLAVLNLTDVAVLCSRAESLAEDPEHRGRSDFALGRAVGPIEELRKLSFPLLNGSGCLIAWRGEDAAPSYALRLTLHASRSYRLPGESRRRHALILAKGDSSRGS